MRTPSTIHRLAAAVAAGLLALTPAVASAQPGREDGFAKPPPLPAGTPVPNDTGRPDLPYEQKTLCVKSLNEGVVLPNKPWGQTQLRFDELHRFATGKGQKVAVIDTGVNRHDFLGDRLAGGGDYVADKNGLEDCDGHGTEVAGIIAANPPANSNIGFKGIAPDAGIVSIRQSSANYEGKDPTDPNAQTRAAGNLLTLAQAIVRAANQVPKGVINMSVDNCRPAGPITSAEVAVQSALRFAVEDRDVVVVASAGNLKENDCNQQNGPDANRPTTIVTPPWFADYVVSVAAIDRRGDPAQFSVQGPWVTVGAPGTEITSLDPGNNSGLANRLLTKDGQPSEIQGTSFAAPYVAGMAALIRERFPNLTARQVMDRIKATSSHPAAAGGRDNLVGYGMINPIAALTAMVPSEQGINPDQPTNITFDMPPADPKDWTPVTVALIGSLGGVGALVLTVFVVHTVRRNRREDDPTNLRRITSA
ncbi:MAG TPA: type VII secretion-associated serine protease mycosin [Actinophytocola sp.]|uniref:type VII secretion-associated serine protease mycosin n=1 Tax=Actinophytocola sp. TaxID=1872138 RepID=UPI002DBD32EF|nr:type VII secretion-associated serine protease mycosin [Actinophytocola sp.]HEU5472143.1 type VII secretion-associated serine protease mycosin [Actinophytocola sp.]